ncbi:MAG: ribonuclease HI family protein [Thaumarchaeota archaeon]|nr:ribonuclease HI family protein [Candidatus Calditenuaceae archaeon]MDW8187313.1 ribonuclease HI family protein [Nitrososphaerota archaeon]
MELSVCKLYIDGSSLGNPGPAGYGFVIEAMGTVTTGSGHIGRATNNVAEYEALLQGLRRCLELRCKRVTVFTDSELLAKQLKGEYRVRSPTLQRLHGEVRALIERFEAFEVRHVRRHENELANRLAQEAAKVGKQDTD